MKWRAVVLVVAVVVAIFAVGMAALTADYRVRPKGPETLRTPVLVAKQLIPKGASGSLVLSHSMYAATTYPARQVEAGAISDPRDLMGRAAAVDILPGQQFTETNFTASDGGTG